jgi:hypothetical protein
MLYPPQYGLYRASARLCYSCVSRFRYCILTAKTIRGTQHLHELATGVCSSQPCVLINKEDSSIVWSRISTVRWYEVAYFSKTALTCACATQRQVRRFWDLITRCTSFLKADSRAYSEQGMVADSLSGSWRTLRAAGPARKPTRGHVSSASHFVHEFHGHFAFALSPASFYSAGAPAPAIAGDKFEALWGRSGPRIVSQNEFRCAGATVAWAKPFIQAISWNGPRPATPASGRLTHLLS